MTLLNLPSHIWILTTLNITILLQHSTGHLSVFSFPNTYCQLHDKQCSLLLSAFCNSKRFKLSLTGILRRKERHSTNQHQHRGSYYHIWPLQPTRRLQCVVCMHTGHMSHTCVLVFVFVYACLCNTLHYLLGLFAFSGTYHEGYAKQNYIWCQCVCLRGLHVCTCVPTGSHTPSFQIGIFCNGTTKVRLFQCLGCSSGCV